MRKEHKSKLVPFEQRTRNARSKLSLANMNLQGMESRNRVSARAIASAQADLDNVYISEKT
ncbi:hypothetical protein J8L86_17600 [Shewanella sp. MMG014]|uniref:hypothetical protein n=1 Tax=Shewanella sp. MMG014 TaxID=2822691 RepID=UPI001B377B4D|nr:hypothetical protein [Shewanella sp. MMG014]MBQ4891666.1 hypothetical protein [Shewanella sp. MMG014]